MITLHLNNRLITCSDETSLQTFLTTQHFQVGTFAVAINQHFIQRANYAQIILKQDDQIDIIRPMQGG